jgi:hypothetical protein
VLLQKRETIETTEAVNGALLGSESAKVGAETRSVLQIITPQSGRWHLTGSLLGAKGLRLWLLE